MRCKRQVLVKGIVMCAASWLADARAGARRARARASCAVASWPPPEFLSSRWRWQRPLQLLVRIPHWWPGRRVLQQSQWLRPTAQVWQWRRRARRLARGRRAPRSACARVCSSGPSERSACRTPDTRSASRLHTPHTTYMGQLCVLLCVASDLQKAATTCFAYRCVSAGGAGARRIA